MFDGCDTESPSLPGSLVSYFPSARKCVSHVLESFTICCVNVKNMALFSVHFNPVD
jgi:hypothetical protein